MLKLKHISGFFFGIGILFFIALSTSYGRQLIPSFYAKWGLLLCGGIAILVNLIGFRTGKHAPLFSLTYWLGCAILFAGIVFKISHWPFSFVLIIAGAILLGVTFFIPSKRMEKGKDEELLDSEIL